MSDREDKRVKKLSGKLDMGLQKLPEIHDAFLNCGTGIAQLEQQLSALSLKPSNVADHHVETNAE